jgi:hypothetical protein
MCSKLSNPMHFSLLSLSSLQPAVSSCRRQRRRRFGARQSDYPLYSFTSTRRRRTNCVTATLAEGDTVGPHEETAMMTPAVLNAGYCMSTDKTTDYLLCVSAPSLFSFCPTACIRLFRMRRLRIQWWLPLCSSKLRCKDKARLALVDTVMG